MTRQFPPGAPQTFPASEAPHWMSVSVRIQSPVPQGDGDHGEPADQVSVVRTVRILHDESGYGHGV